MKVVSRREMARLIRWIRRLDGWVVEAVSGDAKLALVGCSSPPSYLDSARFGFFDIDIGSIVGLEARLPISSDLRICRVNEHPHSRYRPCE